MNKYIISIFISAFLLFQVQPMIAHYILPWFGGTNGVWSAVVLFFQLMLVGGYLYANWLIKSVDYKKQWKIHNILLLFTVGTIIFLSLSWPAPVIPSTNWKPTSTEQPVIYILFLLTISVGLPYFTLASNSPLIQSWFAQTHVGQSPYWLYALSNAGSLLGLLSYPFLVEPSLRLSEQGWLWSGLYIVFAAVTCFIAWSVPRTRDQIGYHRDKDVQATSAPQTSFTSYLLWLSLSAVATLMMLSVTNRLTQEVAPVPLLWILPLTIYLLSFTIAFAGEFYYHRFAFFIFLTVTSVGVIAALLIPTMPILLQIGSYLLFIFAVCMIAHGELYHLRPAPTQLTSFYLLVSIGGALGGFFVNFIAPLIFDDYWELYIGWIIVYSVLLFLAPKKLNTRRQSYLIGSVATVMIIFIGYIMLPDHQDTIWRDRNFYGALRVVENKQEGLNLLIHGSTVHGTQFTAADKRDIPTGYYHLDSGIGLALTTHPHYGQSMKVGIIGLGVGTLAAYGQKGDVYRFYEINPLVISIAQGEHGFFSFLSDSQERGVTIEIVSGDARLSLEQELARGEAQSYDLIVADAFSSDSIPVHLLTLEAFALYLQHLAPDGILAVHISNRHLDLTPIIWKAARHFDLTVGIIRTDAPPDKEASFFPSVWVLLTRQPTIFNHPKLVGKVDTLENDTSNLRPWTDDYSNLLQVIK
ncbi:fused MFS/spermidine synthase [uncultured Chloroflexus sp.]|uniref:fused MFS/spermidine synthase n=1 Tax=uncultured Chloroflexus sp. TaxID=214040 RepID=UPI0026092EE8|nr:fused MFS/spermidine synthase [uncultured Chloroflexus sp.]